MCRDLGPATLQVLVPAGKPTRITFAREWRNWQTRKTQDRRVTPQPALVSRKVAEVFGVRSRELTCPEPGSWTLRGHHEGPLRCPLRAVGNRDPCAVGRLPGSATVSSYSRASRVTEISTMRLMRFRRVGRVYLLATMIALASLTLSQRLAVAQIPDAPGDFNDTNGGAYLGGDSNVPDQKGGPSKGKTDPALQTIDEFQRSKERASGTPEPEPTPHGG